jgi:hypothetical protein
VKTSPCRDVQKAPSIPQMPIQASSPSAAGTERRRSKRQCARNKNGYVSCSHYGVLRNDLVKTFAHRRTQLGGNMGSGNGAHKSMLLPVGRWLQRRIFWVLGNSIGGDDNAAHSEVEEENVHD